VPRGAFAACLAAVLVLGAVLRAVGIDYDRPFEYHSDETTIAIPAMGIAATGNVDPGLFLYPSLLIYAQAAVSAAVHGIDGAPLDAPRPTGVGGLPVLSFSDIDPSQYSIILAGRILIVLFGLVTVVVVAFAGRHLAGPATGLLAALLLAVSPLHVEHSRYLTTDVPSALWTSLVLLVTLAAIRAARVTPLWCLAGLCAGLAASTKYTAGVAVIVPLIGLAVWPATIELRIRVAVASLVVGAAVLGFVIATPMVVVKLAAVLDAVMSQVRNYNFTAHPGAQEMPGLLFNLAALWIGLGPVAAIAAALGLAQALQRRTPEDLVIATFPIVWLVLVSIPQVHFARNLLPMVPFLVIAAARAAVHAAGWLAARNRPGPALTGTLLVVPALVLSVVAAVRLLQPDTRSVAYAWAAANLPGGSVVVRESYTPQIREPFTAGFLPAAWVRSIEWYREHGVDFVILSSDTYLRYISDGFPVERAAYQRLFGLPSVLDVTPGSGLSGPTIRIVDLRH
jgi:hypothetical protein